MAESNEPQGGVAVQRDVRLRAEFVQQREDYGRGYGERKFGFKIGDRVWWVGIEGTGHASEQSGADLDLCRETIRRFNAA